jgi:hypothetical protein
MSLAWWMERAEQAEAEVARLRTALAAATTTARADEREACARLVEVYSDAQPAIRGSCAGRACSCPACGLPATTGGTPDAE